MRTLITPWHGDCDLRRNRSQLVPIQFKSGSTYLKHTIVIQKKAPNIFIIKSHISVGKGMSKLLQKLKFTRLI